MCAGPEIYPEAFFHELAAAEETSEPLQQATKAAVEMMEKEKIMEATLRARGIRSQAAKLLGISRAALYNKLKRYNLTH
jgi:transcriptional regulator of acetoin/glycerol metabolism